MRTRAQCIVHRKDRLLMVRHRLNGEEWWCLPGGGVEEGETAAEAAIRELKEECRVDGTIVRETCVMTFAPQIEARTFLVDIGNQEPRMGNDPEYQRQVIVDIKWLTLAELSECDRAFLWAAGLLGVGAFLEEVSSWRDKISYPGKKEH